MFQDTIATVTKLTELKQLGVRIAVDDFGTGYSSLGYLRRFPVDSLKIARDFVSGDAAAPLTPLDDRWVFATAIIALGRSLGLTVVAEGVETREQLKRLRALGCQQGQGFLFSEALPPDAMGALLLADVPRVAPVRPEVTPGRCDTGPRPGRARVLKRGRPAQDRSNRSAMGVPPLMTSARGTSNQPSAIVA